MGENLFIKTAAHDYSAATEITPIGSFRTDNFWRRLFCNWKTLAFAAVIGAICGTVAYFVVPKKWQATVVVRVGDTVPGHEFERELLEQLSLTAAWIGSQEFIDATLSAMGSATANPADGESSDAKLFKQTLTAKAIPGSQLLRVDYLGYSHQQLQAYVDAIGNQVRAAHDKVMDARMESLNGLRNKYDGELAAEERRYQDLRRKYEDISRQPADVQLFIAPQARAELYESEARMKMLSRAENELDRRITAGRHTAVVTQAEIYVEPVFPKLGKFLPPAILLGILFGFIFSVLRGTTRFVLLK
ncbi:hypothetical protein [Achromobacter spanius]|uniref:hypothetical protein n=1 Tax=Achromobacter spanius TaxID=217203 RepID=UPI0037F73B1B